MDVLPSGNVVPSGNLILELAIACIKIDHAGVERCLLDSAFAVDDSVYTYTLPSAHWPGLVMNASAFVLCSAIAGRSKGIVKLLMYESAPRATIDPGAMNSLPLRCALLYKDQAIIALIGNRTPNCPEKYIGGLRTRHLFELSQAELDAYATSGAIPEDLSDSAKAVMRNAGESFRRILIGQAMGSEVSVVPNTPLHLALYQSMLETGAKEFRIELCMACSLRERQPLLAAER